MNHKSNGKLSFGLCRNAVVEVLLDYVRLQVVLHRSVDIVENRALAPLLLKTVHNIAVNGDLFLKVQSTLFQETLEIVFENRSAHINPYKRDVPDF